MNVWLPLQQELPSSLINLMTLISDSISVAIQNAQLFEASWQQHEQLRTLTARLARAEELERKRLARELHDQVGQNLTALGMNLNVIQAQIPDSLERAEAMRARLNDSLMLVDQTIERIRDVMADLRPSVLDDYGLVAALGWYGEQFTARTGIPVTLQREVTGPRLGAHVEDALFRIFQEALTNVAKHAQATQVTVKVQADAANVRVIIADDGVGFDPHNNRMSGERQGWGLLTMAERAQAIGGKFNIQSSSAHGTKVVVEVKR
jgi:two-component system sensor histidine kinase UhpB